MRCQPLRRALGILGGNLEILISSILETTGLGTFIYFSYKGLSSKLNSLETVVNTQKQTIDTMDKRIEETEKIGGIYRNLISNLPDDLENYKTILSKTKDDVILELKEQKQLTEKKLRLAQAEIENSGNSQDKIAIHLSVLRKLLLSSENNNRHDYDFKRLVEFFDDSYEISIANIVKSNTLDEFFQRLGVDVTIGNEDEIKKISEMVFSNEQCLPTGEYVHNATTSISKAGMYLLADKRAWFELTRYSKLKDEFSSLKTYS